jgi:hypothetical protein
MSGISPQWKKDPQKKEEHGLKRKRGETTLEKLHVLRKEKKERMKFTSCWERLYQKKERKLIIISYSAKLDVWRHAYSHIICICTTYYSLTFPFPTLIHYTILHQPWLIATQTLQNFPLLLQYTRCNIGTSREWTTTKIISREEKSDWEDDWLSDNAWEKGR